MSLLQKGCILFISFSGLFLMLRIYEGSNIFNLNVLGTEIADLGGVSWLYSVVGIIFSVLAAFIIQNEWQQWSNLVAAVRGKSRAWSNFGIAPIICRRIRNRRWSRSRSPCLHQLSAAS